MMKLHSKPYRALHARIYLYGETDSSIGEKVGLSQQQMSARMKGKCPFDAREMLLIGRELNFSQDESEVCSGWQNSPSHYAVIMNPNFTQIGICCFYTIDGKTIWCCTFS